MINFKVWLAATGAAFFFALGWLVKPDEPAAGPTVVTQAQTQVQTVDRVVTKTVTVREVAPNGVTKETKTVDQVRDVKKAAKSSSQTAQIRADPPVDRKWSIGAVWQPRPDPDIYKPVAAEIGHRIGGPVWVTGSFNWQTHEALVGARLEF